MNNFEQTKYKILSFVTSLYTLNGQVNVSTCEYLSFRISLVRI